MRIVSRWLVIAIAVTLAAACSSEPTGPSDTNIIGNWTGTNNVGQSFDVSLAQTGGSVRGSYNAFWASANTSGNVLGMVSGTTFSGFLNNTASACADAVATVSGIVIGNTMTWSSTAGFTGAPASCPQGAFTLTLRKQGQ